jgi:hypothetical protein
MYMGVWEGVATGQGFPKVSPGPAMLDPSSFMPCGLATPETALWPFQGWWSTHRAGGLQPSSTPLDTPRHTPV